MFISGKKKVFTNAKSAARRYFKNERRFIMVLYSLSENQLREAIKAGMEEIKEINQDGDTVIPGLVLNRFSSPNTLATVENILFLKIESQALWCNGITTKP
jgi:hypothetical protein